MPQEPTPRTMLEKIGGWTLGRTLGRGAYGEAEDATAVNPFLLPAHVREATHSSGHKAACKILPALHRDPFRPVTWDETMDAIEAHKEVVLLKALAGAGIKGIVGLEGVLESGGWTYVFLTLYPRSASEHPTPWPHGRLIRFFRALLQTIHALHQLDISHEDLKRSNVLVDEEGWPVVVDFGFSHFKPGGGLVKTSGGTLDYSSPEKVEDKPYEPRANDVWSLGILLTRLLGLPHPYGAHDDTSTRFKQRIVSGKMNYQSLPQHLAPGGVAEVINGMLERDSAKRMTIPQLLAHPYFNAFYRDDRSFKLPSLRLPADLSRPIADSVIEDLCFLAYNNRGFALCETTLKIREQLASPDPCWEKRWAGLLGRWVHRVEMEWEDIPSTRPRTSLSSRAAKAAQPKKARALREIHLSPNVPRPIAPNKQEGQPPITPRRENQENMPPAAPKPQGYRVEGKKSEITPSKHRHLTPKIVQSMEGSGEPKKPVQKAKAVNAPKQVKVHSPSALHRGAFGTVNHSHLWAKVKKVPVEVVHSKTLKVESIRPKISTPVDFGFKDRTVPSSSREPSSEVPVPAAAPTASKPVPPGVTTRSHARSKDKIDGVDLLSPKGIEDRVDILSTRATAGRRRRSPRLVETRSVAG